MRLYQTSCLSVLMLLLASLAYAEDRLDMDGISITGNSELPKALYIVPWKRAEERTSAGKPVNSLVDELLQPLERTAFQRRLVYYQKGDE